MNFADYLGRLNYLKELIEKERLLSLKQAATYFDCSERTIMRMLDVLRTQGYDVQYCRTAKKFIKKTS